jgi:RNase P subunit RPR2
MTSFGYIATALSILGVSYIYLRVFDAWDRRRVAISIRRIGVSVCPRCEQVLGAEAAATATQMMRRGHTPALLTVVCPHCSGELHYRMDGSLFSADDGDWEVYEPNDSNQNA